MEFSNKYTLERHWNLQKAIDIIKHISSTTNQRDKDRLESNLILQQNKLWGDKYKVPKPELIWKEFGEMLQWRILQRTSDSQLFELPLVEIPESHVESIRCPAGPADCRIFGLYEASMRAKIQAKYLKDLRDWEKKGCRGEKPIPGPGTLIRSNRVARIIAAIPALHEFKDTLDDDGRFKGKTVIRDKL